MQVLRQLPRPPIEDPNVLVGFNTSDDAGIYRVSDELALVLTVDFFPPIVVDGYTYGQISAANALSDVYAMGGRPVTALNVMAVPEDLPPSIFSAILKGGADKAAEAGITIIGGHTVTDDEPKYAPSRGCNESIYSRIYLPNTGLDNTMARCIWKKTWLRHLQHNRANMISRVLPRRDSFIIEVMRSRRDNSHKGDLNDRPPPRT